MNNSSMFYVYVGIAGIGVFLIFLLLRSFWEASSERIRSRLEESPSEEKAINLRRQVPKDWSERMDMAFDDLILRTGLELKPDQAIAWMVLVGGALGIGAYFVREEIWHGAVGFAVGALGVLASFFLYRASYINKLQDQLPDTIFLISRSLRAGMSLDQAIELVGNDGVQPLAGEFKRCHAQIRLGLPITVALENMAHQLQMVDMNALVSTVSVFQVTGGNLPMLLDRLAASARDRSALRAHFRTSTALSRISIIPIAMTVPAILIAYYIWQPEYAQTFLESSNGKLIMLGAVVVECLGLYWIYRLLRFEY